LPEIDVEITGKIQTPETPEKEVWPTMLAGDDDFMASFRFKFYRGDTKKDESEDWVVIPEWAGDVEEKGRLTHSRNDCRIENFDYVYIGNDFVLSTEKIQAEYGDEVDTETKWERMPLQILTSRDENKRWTTFDNGMNIRIRLLPNNDTSNPKADVSPDLMEDSSQKGRWTFTDNTSDESDEYTLKGLVTPQKFGLEISEIGTKSICHYIYQESRSAGPLSYQYDWLDPEGIFICPFNTLDDDNYKVTTEPDYTADAVDGHILQAFMPTDVEIYFLFRRWAHYSRLNDLYEEEGSTPEPEIYRICYEVPCEDLDDSTFWMKVHNCGVQEYMSYIDYIEGYCGDTGYHMRVQVGGSNIELHGDVYIGLWWAPPPLTFSIGSPQEDTKRAEFGYQTDVDDNPIAQVFELVGDETQEQAQEHFIQAGGTEEDAAKIIGGYNSLHIFAPTEWSWYHIKTPIVVPADVRWQRNHASSFPGGKLVNETEDPEDTFYYAGNVDLKDVLGNIYLGSISPSEFYQTYRNPDNDYAYEGQFCTGSPLTDEAYGVGLSPMQEGTLCAIVKVKSKAYYIWRKTEEEFTEKTVQVSGGAFGKPFLGFEPTYASECYQYWQHFSGSERRIDKILTPKTPTTAYWSAYGFPDFDCTYELGLAWATTWLINQCGCGERLMAQIVLAGEGTVTLESPVYPIVARDFAKIGNTFFLNRTVVYNTTSTYNVDHRRSF